MAYRLSHEDRARIQAAVRDGEAGSNAHIAFVAVPASDHYALYPVVWAALVTFIAAGISAFAVHHLYFRTAFVGEVILFVLLSAVLEWRPLKLLTVPRHVRRAHANALAEREFAARILASSERRGGVLLFVSLGERYARLIADRDTHARVGQAAWDRILAEFTAMAKRGRLAEAAAAAIGTLSLALKSHPPS